MKGRPKKIVLSTPSRGSLRTAAAETRPPGGDGQGDGPPAQRSDLRTVPAEVKLHGSPGQAGQTAGWYRANHYFERQQLALCGMHALNNALGQRLFCPEDFTQAVDTLEEEAAVPDAHYVAAVPFDRDAHIGPRGWYSDEAIGMVLRQSARYQMLLAPLAGDNLDILAAADIPGAIVNMNNTHWVALRFVNNAFWLLDSLREPKAMSRRDVGRFLVRYPRAYPIQRLVP